MLTDIIDVDLQILSYIDDEELNNICKLNSCNKSLCQNNHLWILKIKHTFPNFPIDDGQQNAKQLYRKLLTDDINELFNFFLKKGNLNLAKWLVKNYKKDVEFYPISKEKKFKIISAELVQWLYDEDFDDFINVSVTGKAFEEGNIDVIEILMKKKHLNDFNIKLSINLAFANAKLNVLQYFDDPALYRLIDKEYLGHVIKNMDINIKDFMEMFRWLYDKKYFLTRKNFIASDIIIDKRLHIKDLAVGRIRNINPSRLIAVLDWIYLETDLVIDYDYITNVIKKGIYEKETLKNYDQKELLLWLEEHKAADEIV